MKMNKRDGEGSNPIRNNENSNNVTGKIPFDKKKYRLQKYSNKYKVAQWEERRKRAVLHGFYKERHKEEQRVRRKPYPLGSKEWRENQERCGITSKQVSPFQVAKVEFHKLQAEKHQKKEEIRKARAEREEALRKYKEKKMEMYKKLSRKTKKGQPVMKERLALLLEKIKESSF